MTTQATSPQTAPQASPEAPAQSWTFLSIHAHTLLLIERDPTMRMKDMAAAIGITERAVQRIIDDLTHEGYVAVERDGRRNHYSIDRTKRLRHPIEAHNAIAELLKLA
jgi:predicted ArsR family transcriptional regulator